MTDDEKEEQAIEIGDVAEVHYKFQDGITVTVFAMEFADVAEEAAQSYRTQAFAAIKRQREAERSRGMTTIDMGKIHCPHCGGTDNTIAAMITEGVEHIYLGLVCHAGVSFEVEIQEHHPTGWDSDRYVGVKVHAVVNWEHTRRHE